MARGVKRSRTSNSLSTVLSHPVVQQIAQAGYQRVRNAARAVVSRGAQNVVRRIRDSFTRVSNNRRRPVVATNRPRVPRVVARRRREPGLPSGPIKPVTKGPPVTKQDPYRVMMKIEKGESYVGWHCMYPGGVTHPLYYTFLNMSLSIIRYFMMKAKIEFGSWIDKPMMPLVSDAKWFVRYYTKADGDLPDQLRARDVGMTGLATWQACAEKLCDSIVEVFGSTQQVLRMTHIGIFPDRNQTDLTEQSFVASQFYNARDIYITIKGESTLQVQNRTLADSGAGDIYDAANIFNNPMRGKYYSFKKGRPFIRNIAHGTGTNRASFESNNDGLISQQDRYTSGGTSASNFSDAVSNEIRKPPSGNYFINCTNTKTVNVLPGAILTSRHEETVTHSLNTWISLFKNKFDMVGVKTLDGLRLNAEPLDYRVGSSHMYGLEKMVDTDKVETNQLEIGVEHNLFMSSKMEYRPKHGAVSIVKIST